MALQVFVWKFVCRVRKQSDPWKHQELRLLEAQARPQPLAHLQQLVVDDGAMHKPKRPRLWQVWRPWNLCL